MALQTNGTTQYLSLSSAVISGWPLTMASFINLDDTSGLTETILCLGNSGDNNPFIRIAKDSTNVLVAQARDDAAVQNSNAGGTITAAAYQHAGMTIDLNGVPTPYLNGSSTTPTATTTLGTITLDQTSIGVLLRIGAVHYWDGAIAEPAIWDVELNTSEMTALSNGFLPNQIRPNNLIMWLRLIRGVYVDVISGQTFSATGTPTISAHKPVIEPFRFAIPRLVSGTILPFMNHYA